MPKLQQGMNTTTSYRERLRQPVPAHIAIIMDGNGRWAQQRGLERNVGHQQGVETVKKVTEECVRIGVKYLTLYTFSTENWNRPAAEVTALMRLVLASLEEEIFVKNAVRFRMIGDASRLPEDVRERIEAVEKHTEAYERLTLTIALSYSARWEITEAAKKIATDAKVGRINPEDIEESTVARYLATSYMPDPDLLIRTGGELRISNYLLWQCAYSELYFTDIYWPDFDGEQLCKAIADFQNRERRYGKTHEQIKN